MQMAIDNENIKMVQLLLSHPNIDVNLKVICFQRFLWNYKTKYI